MVWDLPTRLFHWGLAISIAGAYISGENGWQDIHEIFGLTVLGLIIFRLIWGIIGHPTARLAALLPAPRVLFDYIKSLSTHRGTPYYGHNPLGGLAVIALLSVSGAMALTGLWNSDDILYEAPMRRLAPWGSFIGRWHIPIHFFVLPLIALHLLALLTHRLWLKEKLVTRMLTGGTHANAQNPERTMRGLFLMMLCLGTAHSLPWLAVIF